MPSVAAESMMVALHRRLLDLGAVLSLLACVAAALLWARSYRLTDSLAWTGQGRGVGVVASKGQVSFRLSTFQAGPQLPRGWRHDVHPRPATLAVPYGASTKTLGRGPDTYTAREWGVAGFGVRQNSNQNGTSGFLLLPHWFLVALAATLPVVWIVRRWRGARREKKGLCPRCGYDLRATPGRCPECGEGSIEVPAPSAAQPAAVTAPRRNRRVTPSPPSSAIPAHAAPGSGTAGGAGSVGFDSEISSR